LASASRARINARKYRRLVQAKATGRARGGEVPQGTNRKRAIYVKK